MTITRRWQAGAECDTTNSPNIEFDIVNGNFAASATQKRTDTYGFKVQGGSGGDDSYGQKNVTATYQIRIGLHIYGDLGAEAYSGKFISLVTWRSAGGRLGSLRIDDAADLHLYIDDVSQDEEVGAMPIEDWAHFGIHIKIDGSAGWVPV